MRVFQSLDDDEFQRRGNQAGDTFAAMLAAHKGKGKPVIIPEPEEKAEYIFGLIKEMKPGEVRAPGTRFQPPPYTFVDGKRVANRSQRFSGR